MAAMLALLFTLIGSGLLAFGLDGLQVPVDSLYRNAIIIGSCVMFAAGVFCGNSSRRGISHD